MSRPLRLSPIHVGIGMISASSLAFEIVLTRLFAVQQFHHFAFVVVSLAVMGIAASGTLLAAKPKHPPFPLLALLYSASVLLAYFVIDRLPFDSYAIAWDQRQIWILLLYFLASGLPFLCSGWAVGAALAQAGPEAHLPYAANLLGSALGCLLALAALQFMGGVGALLFVVTLGLASAASFSSSWKTRMPALTAAGLALAAGFLVPPALSPRLSPYKALSYALLAPDAKTTHTLWSATSRLDVVESSSIHTFPGLSINARTPLPEQTAVFIDGDGPLPMTSLDPETRQASQIAESMPSSLAYQFRPSANALILQPGANLDAALALASNASHVTISVPEPLIPGLLTGPYADFTQRLIEHDRLTLIHRSDRGALRTRPAGYDIIQFALTDTYRPVTSGAFSLTENFTLTVQAIRDAYRALTGKGIIILTRWLGTPPSESARAWATVLAALEAEGLNQPEEHLIAYRGMRTATIIASQRPFTPGELSTAREFLKRNAFDPIFLPDLKPWELNRFNHLPEDTYYELFSHLLSDLQGAVAAYDFNLSPPSDDRPFFFHFFRWRQTPQVLATLGLVSQPFGGSGYLVILVLLALMTILALPMALTPLILLRRTAQPSLRLAAPIGFFAFLGAGYLVVEIPLIQRLTLLLDRPATSLAVVLFTLLLTSGIGSLLSPRIPLRLALGALVAVALVTAALTPSIMNLALPWPFAPRLALTALLLSPLGLLMGIPFASGLRRLQTQASGLVPLAWGINGAVSGVSGVLAALCTMDLGFTATLVLGALAYVGALALILKPEW